MKQKKSLGPRSVGQNAKDTCQHCGKGLINNHRQYGFCCLGCQAAHAFIKSLNLDDYYKLAQGKELLPAVTQGEAMVELFDDIDFRSSFCSTNSDGTTVANLYIGGLSCYACVWLVQNAIKKERPEVKLDINLSSGFARIQFRDLDAPLSETVALIRRLGFRVNPSAEGDSQENVRDLVRLGVATFCFMNVMLLSVPEYIDPSLSLESGFWQMFRWLSLGLASVVVTYCAAPFYRGALLNLQQRRMGIDLSLSLALLATFFYSAVNVVRAEGAIYLDSVCAIIALLGWGRYLQKRVMQNAAQSILTVFDHSMQFVRKSDMSGVLPLARVREGDSFAVLAGDPIPVDCEVESGSSAVSYEQLTGEADLVAVSAGSAIKSGAINMTGHLDLVARQSGGQSFVHQISTVIERIQAERSRFSSLADQLGGGFFVLVMIVALMILFSHWSTSPEEAIKRAIAALLIACPCAFGFAVPLTMAGCAASALRRGIIIKSQRAIEALGAIKSVFFDKTGTLTGGKPVVVCADWDEAHLSQTGASRLELLAALQNLRRHSSHHTVHALAAYALNEVGPQVEAELDAKESIGEGISFACAGSTWLLGRPAYVSLAAGSLDQIWLGTRAAVVARFEVRDSVRSDAHLVVKDLHAAGYLVGIISGDTQSNNNELAKELGIDQRLVFGRQTPTEKVERLVDGGRSLMVGNGFNDSLALVSAGVGLAVAHSNQQAKNAAEICLSEDRLIGVVEVLNFGKVARRKLRQAFAFAVAYNLGGLSLAAVGAMHPVVAAALMPVSSLAVIVITGRWPRRSLS